MFSYWIGRLKAFLFTGSDADGASADASVPEEDFTRRSFIIGTPRGPVGVGASVADQSNEQDNPVASKGGVFELCMSEPGRVLSQEEQNILLCLEQCHQAR